MISNKFVRFSLLVGLLALFGLSVLSVSAASSATITFDGDVDQPSYFVVATDPVDDDSGCDYVTMVMVDANGFVTDSDTFCLDLVGGEGFDETDWGSIEDSYYPEAGPITYALFDTAPGDPCENDENSFACIDYINSGAVACIGEAYFQPDSLSAGTPYSVCGSVGVNAVACPYPLPAGSVVKNIPAGALAYFQPNLESYAGFNLTPGTWYVSETSGDFSKVWIACQASPIWVPTANVLG